MTDDTPQTRPAGRLVEPAEFAAHLQVAEDDILEWIAEGRLPTEPGPDGRPRLRILREEHGERGTLIHGFFMYATGSLTQAELTERRRQRELESFSYDGPIDIDTLTEAIARRLAAVVPDPERARPWHGIVFGTDIPLSVSYDPTRPVQDVMRGVADGVLRMWWGEAHSPILELEPLPVAEVLRAPRS
jgi:hypothetical protein